jgi:thiamine biosynthesis lipoprotein
MVGTGVREQPLWAADWRAIGTAIRLVVTSEAALPPGRVLLEAELAALDVACSRFREDSELVRLGASGGRPVRVSPLLAELVAVALQAAEATEGDVDPTVGAAMAAAGYDRDFELVASEGPRVRLVVRRLPDWRDVLLDTDRGLLTVPDGVMLDLGATAKSWLADHAAAALAAELGCGVLVSLGGDIAVAGQPPAQGWRIRVQDITTHPDAPPLGPSAMVKIRAGGLATSSTTARRWRRGGDVFHHILDPRSGLPAAPVWRTVSVTGGTAVEANAASTASVIRGEGAPKFLAERGLAARLVSAGGDVLTVGGWPREVAA